MTPLMIAVALPSGAVAYSLLVSFTARIAFRRGKLVNER